MKLSTKQLRENLKNFVGTAGLHRILPTFAVTDGFKYLIDEANCYWLAQLYGLHLVSIDFNDFPFTILKITKNQRGARINIEDGNGQVIAWQRLEFTDFPFNRFTLYACWSGEQWVAMLPSEY